MSHKKPWDREEELAASDKTAAQLLGCRCDVCPLFDAEGPVLPEVGSQPRITVVGEYPDKPEVSHGRPFVGPAGAVLFDALHSVGVGRAQVAGAHAVMCRPPDGQMRTVLALTSKENTRIKRANRATEKANAKRAAHLAEPLSPLIPSPMECCAPGLEAFLARAPTNVLMAGKLAAGALLGGSPSIMAIRGGPLDGRLIRQATGELALLGPEDMHEPQHRILMPEAKLIPTLYPPAVLNEPKWKGTLGVDVDRLVRWSRGPLQWKNPTVTYHPPPQALYDFLLKRPAYTYDLETDGIEPMACNVRCVGIGDGTGQAVVVGIRSKDTWGSPGTCPACQGACYTVQLPGGYGPCRTCAGQGRIGREDYTFYSPAEMAQILQILSWFFASPDKLKIGHNAGYYDKLVVRQWLGVEAVPILDTLLLHRLAWSELPHSLSYVASFYLDIHSWKSDRKGRKLATESESDGELHKYCGMDIGATEGILEPVLADVNAHGQAKVVAIDHAVQTVCADMKHVGMRVDQTARAEAERKGLAKMVQLREELQGLAGDPAFNPGSVQMLSRILFDKWKLEPPLDDKIRFTATGSASTSDDVMRSLLTLRIEKRQRRFLQRIRAYRRVMKELGTYIVKLRHQSEVISGIGWDEDEAAELAENEWEQEQAPELLMMMAEERRKRGYEKRGIVWADERMRPGYNAGVTVSGRLSSSRPLNAQNFPKHLRALIVAQPGNVLVGSDYDQLELRIAAARWGLKKYLDAFDAGWDPHTSVTAYAVFGEAFASIAGSSFPWMTGTEFEGDANMMRQLAKIIQYAFQYLASVETGMRIIHATELKDGSLPFARLGLKEVQQFRESWLGGVPQLKAGWAREIETFRRQGFLEDPIHGRRRYFLNGENPNEIVNTPIQFAAAALVNDSMIEIHEDIPLHKWGPGTGLLTQTHDSLVVECPEKEAQWVMECMDHHMNKRHPALPGVLFSAKAKQGRTWKEVG